ncbi:hypothetical protein K1719_006876 [Acacia pycnantha]|nr:hypothetical protein K1719_006876 [Acacia pycnantha]
MTEISEVPLVAQDIEARVQRIARAIVITNGIYSDEEQSHSLLRALNIHLEGILHHVHQRPNRLWFIRWLPNFLYNNFPDLSWFRRSDSLPVSTQQAGPSALKISLTRVRS